MAVGAILAGALTDASARTYSLWLEGLDVLREPGGGQLGTPIDSIRVEEAGSGGVSSIEFTVNDPSLEVTMTDAAPILYYDHVRDVPIFRGFVQAWSIEPAFGNQGRRIRVTGVGIEAVLDWAVTTADLTFDFLGGTIASVQSIIANSQGLGPIRAFTDPTGAIAFGNQELPIGINFGPGLMVPSSVTIRAGTTVRQAILDYFAAFGGFAFTATGEDKARMYLSVDFWYGLRLFPDYVASPGPAIPADYTTEAVSDTFAGPIRAEDLAYDVNPGEIRRSVLVIGTAVSATVSDGSGKPGPTGVVRDSSLSSVAGCQAAGGAYLAQFSAGVRGSYGVSDRTPVATVHAGSFVEITDPRAGLAGEKRRIMAIAKTFNKSGRENWVISFGGLPPSAAASVRRLTRDLLS